MSWLDENPNCARTYAAFRLVGDMLDPDDVTRALNLQPSSALAKGQEIPAGRIGPVRRQRTGVWLLSTDELISSTSLERHLLHLLDALEPAAAALHVLVSAEDVRADFLERGRPPHELAVALKAALERQSEVRASWGR